MACAYTIASRHNVEPWADAPSSYRVALGLMGTVASRGRSAWHTRPFTSICHAAVVVRGDAKTGRQLAGERHRYMADSFEGLALEVKSAL